MKTLISVLSVSAALLLSACHGQNPFDRNSDPTKDYPELNQAMPAAKVPPKKPDPVIPDPLPPSEQNPCPKIFDIGLNEGRGRLLKFEPGKSGQVTLIARSYRKGQFALELLDAPKGMQLSMVKSEGTGPNSLSFWNVEWTPGDDLISSTGAWESVVSFKYTNNNAKNALCGNHASEEFNVLVFADANAVKNPVVSVTNLPQGRIQFGDRFNFKVTVSNAGQRQAPVVNFGFNSDAFNTSTTLNAENAVGCSDAKLVDAQWVFSCDFASDKIADTGTIKKWLNSNKEVTGRFDTSATSAGRSSAQVRGLVRVFFPGAIAQPETTQPEQKETQPADQSGKTDKGV